MAISFLEKRKIQKQFILILIAIVLITILVIWRGFFAGEKITLPKENLEQAKKVKINFDILEDPILKSLEPFTEIEPIGESVEFGRENPFQSFLPSTPSSPTE